MVFEVGDVYLANDGAKYVVLSVNHEGNFHFRLKVLKEKNPRSVSIQLTNTVITVLPDNFELAKEEQSKHAVKLDSIDKNTIEELIEKTKLIK
ncbi:MULTISPECIES: hypothetical protein [Paenibacillus]|uniref:hypothetical protein n=1 Tax=Paenibacillus TaxID=44249 RepID=UPI000B83FBE5|nr:hypothetical protein [Paenibacillus amylolyticus]